MKKLYIDLETFCETPITSGTYRYAEGAEILLCAWAIDDAPVQVLDMANGEQAPRELQKALADRNVVIVAHNSNFDRTVLRRAIPEYAADPTRWQDTMVKATSVSLPGKLEVLSVVLKLGVDQAKDKEGKALINLFCKPRPKSSKVLRATKETNPIEWDKFVEYARLDVEAMRAIDKNLPSWNYSASELALWRLDQRINDRGVCVDVELAQSALRAVESTQADLKVETQRVTDGAVGSATQRDEVLKYALEAYGVKLPDLQASTVERRLQDPDLPAPLKELLAIRLQASTSSTSKYKSLLKSVSRDGRLRGLLQFNGASRTGRWSGRVFQPQNLPRPSLKQKAIELGIEALKSYCADLVFDDIMQLTSSAIRGCIVASQDNKLVVSDLSNIEGRAQAWLAGETWKLKAFKDFDNGEGHDLYKLAYANAFHIKPEDVTKDQRQIGKVMELMLGYAGGVGAFLTGAATYRFEIEELGATFYPHIPLEIRLEAEKFLGWMREQKRSTHGLSQIAFVVCDSLKRMWRNAHPNISAHWKELEDTCRDALACPGDVFLCRKLKITRTANWLRIVLPSGRNLCYPGAKIDDEGRISYMGMNQYSRKWERLHTYGGKLFENICQAVARDVMAANMQQIEDAGYMIVLTVHDEVICEAPDTDEFNVEHLSSLLATPPAWALDMPLAAGGFEDYRYRKD